MPRCALFHCAAWQGCYCPTTTAALAIGCKGAVLSKPLVYPSRVNTQRSFYQRKGGVSMRTGGKACPCGRRDWLGGALVFSHPPARDVCGGHPHCPRQRGCAPLHSPVGGRMPQVHAAGLGCHSERSRGVSRGAPRCGRRSPRDVSTPPSATLNMTRASPITICPGGCRGRWRARRWSRGRGGGGVGVRSGGRSRSGGRAAP